MNKRAGNRIIGRRVTKDFGCQFLIQWEGRKASSISWDDADNFENPSTVNIEVEKALKPIPGAQSLMFSPDSELLSESAGIAQWMERRGKKRDAKSRKKTKIIKCEVDRKPCEEHKLYRADERAFSIHKDRKKFFSCELEKNRIYIINYISPGPAYFNNKLIDAFLEELSCVPEDTELCCFIFSSTVVKNDETESSSRDFIKTFQKFRNFLGNWNKPLVLFLNDAVFEGVSAGLFLLFDHVLSTENTQISFSCAIENDFHQYISEEMIAAYGFNTVRRLLFSGLLMNSSVALQIGLIFRICFNKKDCLKICESLSNKPNL